MHEEESQRKKPTKRITLTMCKIDLNLTSWQSALQKWKHQQDEMVFIIFIRDKLWFSVESFNPNINLRTSIKNLSTLWIVHDFLICCFSLSISPFLYKNYIAIPRLIKFNETMLKQLFKWCQELIVVEIRLKFCDRLLIFLVIERVHCTVIVIK